MQRKRCQKPCVIIGTAIIVAKVTQTSSAFVSRRSLKTTAKRPTSNVRPRTASMAGMGMADSEIVYDSQMMTAV